MCLGVLFLIILVRLWVARIHVNKFDDDFKFVDLGLLINWGGDEVVAVDDEPLGVFHALVHFLYKFFLKFAIGKIAHLVDWDLFAG